MPALTTFIIFTTFVHLYKFFQLNSLPYFYHFLPTFITFYHLYYFSPPFTTFCLILPLLSLFTTFNLLLPTFTRPEPEASFYLKISQQHITFPISALLFLSMLYFSVPALVFTTFPYHLPHYFFNFPLIFPISPTYLSNHRLTFLNSILHFESRPAFYVTALHSFHSVIITYRSLIIWMPAPNSFLQLYNYHKSIVADKKSGQRTHISRSTITTNRYMFALLFKIPSYFPYSALLQWWAILRR